jgi:hypothetical protein
MSDLVSIIPLKQIDISKNIVLMVEKIDPHINEDFLKVSGYRIINDDTFSLDTRRFESIKDAIRTNLNLPPIDIKISEPPLPARPAFVRRGQPPRMTEPRLARYIVLNGRHRVAVALSRGDTHVRAFVNV